MKQRDGITHWKDFLLRCPSVARVVWYLKVGMVFLVVFVATAVVVQLGISILTSIL